MLIPLIRDIRQGAPGVRIPFQSTETLVRRPPESVRLPFGPRPGFQLGPLTLQGDFFVAEVNAQWVLDGHRYLVNEQEGFFLDRVVKLTPERVKELLYSDGDTGLRHPGPAVGFTYTPKRPDLPVVDLPGRVGLAVSVEPSNWGSFLTRVLPKAVLLRSLGVDRIVACCVHASQRQMLERVGWRPDQIINQVPAKRYRAQEMVLPSELAEQLAMGLMGRSLLERLRPPPQRQDRKLFVSRRPRASSHNQRHCLNHDALEARMTALGFETVSPELYSASEQMQLFAEAAIVVGPSGAGMFNTVFCAPGTAVLDIESETNWIHGHSCLFSSLGLRYAIHVARPTADPTFPPPHRPFEINLDALAEQVESLQRSV